MANEPTRERTIGFLVAVSEAAAHDVASYAHHREMRVEAALREIVESWARGWRDETGARR